MASTHLDRTLEEVLGDSRSSDLEKQAETVLQEDTTPWFLQPFIFLGAIVAAVMFSAAFLVMLDAVIHVNRWNAAQLSCMGAVYLLVAVFLHRRRLNIYTNALALALSLGGHGFIMWAISQDTTRSQAFMTAFLVFLGLCAALYFLYRDGLHRYLTVVLVLILAKAAFSKAHLDLCLHGFALLTTCLAAWLLTRERELPNWRPLAYGCCTGLVVLLLPLGHRRGVFDFTRHAMTQPWISSVLMGIALLWILRWATQRPGLREKPIDPIRATIVVVVTAGLAALSTPGLLAAMFLAALGHATYHGRITLLGLLSLPIFFWKYYYNLEVGFLTKSGVLVASGLVVLLARWGLTRTKEHTT